MARQLRPLGGYVTLMISRGKRHIEPEKPTRALLKEVKQYGGCQGSYVDIHIRAYQCTQVAIAITMNIKKTTNIRTKNKRYSIQLSQSCYVSISRATPNTQS